MIGIYRVDLQCSILVSFMSFSIGHFGSFYIINLPFSFYLSAGAFFVP